MPRERILLRQRVHRSVDAFQHTRSDRNVHEFGGALAGVHALGIAHCVALTGLGALVLQRPMRSR
jgi:hypothetical protein